VKLSELFHSLLLTRPDLFTVLTGPAFALTVLTVRPKGWGKCGRRPSTTCAGHPDPRHEACLNDFTADAEARYTASANAVTQAVYERVNGGGQVFLTSGVVGGTYNIRVVSANPMAEEKYLRRAFEILVKEAEAVIGVNEEEWGI